MVRLAEVPEGTRNVIRTMACPRYDSTPFAKAPAVEDARVAIISTAGLQRRGDRPFASDADDYRIIPADTPPGDIVMSHISPNYDRTGFQQDLNVVFPLDRLREMAAAGEIASVASYHYSFMGATSPEELEETAKHLAGLLKGDGVNLAFLIPV